MEFVVAVEDALRIPSVLAPQLIHCELSYVEVWLRQVGHSVHTSDTQDPLESYIDDVRHEEKCENTDPYDRTVTNTLYVAYPTFASDIISICINTC